MATGPPPYAAMPPLALRDNQITIIMAIAASVPVAKLCRIRRPGDADVERAARAPLKGLMQAPAA
jgi:hypothetical protein